VQLAPSADDLNRLRRQGVVAVRYRANGCDIELEVLSNCIGTGTKYEFSPYSANEHKVARNAGELFAKLPIGAARLSAALTGDRELRTDYIAAPFRMSSGVPSDAATPWQFKPFSPGSAEAGRQPEATAH
jgi:hypothetical protein